MRRALSVVMLTAIVLTVSACKPDYPSCGTDKDCREKEYCVDRKCQQCRAGADCPEGQACTAGQCSAMLGYCRVNAECQEDQVCVDHRCQRCTADTHCAPPSRCEQGRCMSATHCVSRFDCSDGEDCVGGICAPGAGASCNLPSVHFDFNEATLTIEATGRLADAVNCLKGGGAATALGHADPRGTQEYNLALSERRARMVREHLERLGVDSGQLNLVPRGALDAKGTDEASWASDRRVDLTWR
jgi:peptidoglycan-associated lipoprotein